MWERERVKMDKIVDEQESKEWKRERKMTVSLGTLYVKLTIMSQRCMYDVQEVREIYRAKEHWHEIVPAPTDSVASSCFYKKIY